MASSYSDKLRDPRWQKKRLDILNRDDFTCQLCRRTDRTLHVHHQRYHGDPWDTPSEELETLCEVCHDHLSEIAELARALVPETPFRSRTLLDAMEYAIMETGIAWQQRFIAFAYLRA